MLERHIRLGHISHQSYHIYCLGPISGESLAARDYVASNPGLNVTLKDHTKLNQIPVLSPTPAAMREPSLCSLSVRAFVTASDVNEAVQGCNNL